MWRDKWPPHHAACEVNLSSGTRKSASRSEQISAFPPDSLDVVSAERRQLCQGLRSACGCLGCCYSGPWNPRPTITSDRPPSSPGRAAALFSASATAAWHTNYITAMPSHFFLLQFFSVPEFHAHASCENSETTQGSLWHSAPRGDAYICINCLRETEVSGTQSV